MSQSKRILIAIVILILLVGAILGLDALRRMNTAGPETDVPPGAIPITVDGQRAGTFAPTDLEVLEQVSFVDAEEDKTQEGWLLRDVLLLHVDPAELEPDTTVTVSSSSREKSAQLTWAQIDDAANWVMFDLSGRGTLKLVSTLEKLDTRDEWVQDVDLIEVTTK